MECRHYILLLLLYFILTIGQSCSVENKTESTSINRFEIDINLYNKLSDTEKINFKNKYADIISIIYNDNTNVDSILLLIPSSVIYQAFTKDVSSKFLNLDSTATVLGSVNSNLQSIFKDFTAPHVKTYITKYNQSIVTTDTTVLIALNQYLGAGHPMYEYYEPYQRLKKVPSQITYDYAEALIRSKIDILPSNKNTLLDKIIYEGMVAYLITEVTPNSNSTNFLAYTQEQIKWCKSNEINIWKSILSNDILYSKSQLISKQLLSPAPFTMLISQDCPGEIGRWIGYQIILKYVENNEIDDLNRFINTIINTDGQTILMKAKYDGQ